MQVVVYHEIFAMYLIFPTTLCWYCKILFNFEINSRKWFWTGFWTNLSLQNEALSKCKAATFKFSTPEIWCDPWPIRAWASLHSPEQLYQLVIFIFVNNNCAKYFLEIRNHYHCKSQVTLDFQWHLRSTTTEKIQVSLLQELLLGFLSRPP